MKKMLLVPALLGIVGVSATVGSTNADAAYTLDQIKDLALTEVNGTITDIEYENKGTRSYYEVEVLTADAQYELKYDATTGKLLKKEIESYDDDNDDDHYEYKSYKNNKYSTKTTVATSTTATVQAKLTVAEIQQKALAIVSGTVTEVDYEKGYYEVDVVDGTTKYELKLNASTGELIAKKQETKKYRR